jgi:signal transduction histidine kinase
MLLFPLWYPTFDAAIGYARFLGRQVGCDVRVNNSDGRQVDIIQIRFAHGHARSKTSLNGRNALELQASNRELRQQIDSMTRLEWELLETNEREHRRFGWDLHEDLGQQLAGITFLASVLAKQLESNCPDLGNDLRVLVSQLRDTILHTRNIARGLYPIGLENGGLLMVLEELAGWTTQIEGIPCSFRNDGGFKFSQASAIHLYRIAQEGMNHLLKTGKARRISIECGSFDFIPRLIIAGDGVEIGLASLGGAGLDLMHSRARMIGAEVKLSERQEGCCVIACTLKRPEPEG